MKLNELVSGYDKAKVKHNEIVSDKIEKLSDEKERADDMLTSVKERLEKTLSPVEADVIRKQIVSLQARKKVLQDQISRERERKI